MRLAGAEAEEKTMLGKNIAKYSGKHPPGTTPDPAIAAAATARALEGHVTCATAHDLATELAVTPGEVGRTIDLLDLRLTECQMGLFGYSPEKSIVRPAGSVSKELRSHLQNATKEDKISCASCWEVAELLGLEKMEVAAACNKLNLKIEPCQLGAF